MTNIKTCYKIMIISYTITALVTLMFYPQDLTLKNLIQMYTLCIVHYPRDDEEVNK